ncbi:hypothetical protein L1D29_03265 [Shewanella insulae]|uniref:hypothetical protein n=1 Tax=Shewanella insulae TaxID=2681496 RepID=UPI001EFC889C|nr:hypothetical protein [Shewanella insulae]MCG9711838.1 hypothetical protein [Shewanella insulae]
MDTSDYIASAAVVIAFCALAVSIWQGYVMRLHQKLSVKPHIDIDYKFFPGKPIEIRMLNNGVGPAIIKSFKVLYDGKSISENQTDAYLKVLKELKTDTELEFKYEYNFPLKNEALSSGENEYLLQVELVGEYDESATSRAKSSLSRIGFKTEYECMYGNKFVHNMPLLFSNN